MKKSILCAIIVVLFIQCYAQSSLKSLHVGDQMPAFRFKKIINSNKASMDLKDYRGKYILLDLWATNCAQCINAFPHVQELSDFFKGKLQIILVDVGDEDGYTKKVIDRVVKKYKLEQNISITVPVALNDPLIRTYFPGKGVPHEIIIDPKGKIRAITNMEDITKVKLKALIAGQNVNFELSDEFWNKNIPFVAVNNTSNNKGIIFSSSFTEVFPNDNRRGGIKLNENGEIIGIVSDQEPLINFYNLIYSDLRSEETIYETKNPVFQLDSSKNDKFFRYDLILPPGQFTNEKYKECLKLDLEKIYNFTFRKEQRKVPCLIVRNNGDISKSLTKYEKTESNSDEEHYDLDYLLKNHIGLYYHNVGYDYLNGIGGLHLDKIFNAFKIVYELDVHNNLDLDFPPDFNFNNKEAVTAFLHERGIDLTVEYRDIDVLIVSDKKSNK